LQISNGQSQRHYFEPEPRRQNHFLNHYGEGYFGYSAKEISGKPMLGTLTPATGFEGRDLAGFLPELVREPNRYAYSVNMNMLRNGTPSGYSGPTRVFTMTKGRCRKF
jgi:hypothetical protein